jgi:ubiquinone/menaquinone biosynthesis C-methylase UbiE
MDDACWNPDVPYHPLVLHAVPPNCGEALDVGCGGGLLARRQAARARRATGLDQAGDMVRPARESSAHLDNVEFLEGDFFALAGEALP